MKALFVLAPLFLGLVTASHANEPHHRQHGAHQHGQVELNIAIEGNTIYLEMHSPGYNIVGFEHQVQSDEQHQAVKRALQLLGQADALFVFTGDVCQAREVDVTTELLQPVRHGHGEFEANYLFQCKAITQLEVIDVQLFDFFPNISEVRAQFITDKEQKIFELNSVQRKIRL